MRRRTLLVGAMGLAGGVGFGSAFAAGPDKLEQAIWAAENTGSTDVALGPSLSTAVGGIQRGIEFARRTFQGARYGELVDFLPGLISRGSRFQHRFADKPSYTETMAELYTLTSAFMVKVGHDQLADTSARKARKWAAVTGNLSATAKASRAQAIVLRRAGQIDEAQEVLLGIADDLRPLLSKESDLRSIYGSSLATAAYTAAVAGDGDAARSLIAEAQGVVAEGAQLDQSDPSVIFSAASLGLYQMSIAQVGHDFSGVLECSRQVDLSVIPQKERRARYWVDLAKAFYHEEKNEHCYRALLSAEQISPDEVRFRKPVHVMATGLLSSPVALPGLHDFARRAGVTL